MDPSRKRRIRLVVAATAALLLASALVYTSFSAGSDEKTAGQLIQSARAGETYTLAGTVAPGSVRRGDGVLWFSVLDPNRPGTAARVRYTGLVPDPFREGRGVMVKVQLGRSGLDGAGTTFVGEKDSMVTKCPSKFQVAPENLPRGASEELMRAAPSS
jgi:cytochrome c-type biogenesis protein CcmE